jgi:hypothetical protein
MPHANIAGLRCFNHGTREAVAQCLQCARYYCRECVTEHGTRVLCATCLERTAVETAPRPRAITVAWRVAQLLMAFCVVWFVAYAMGRGLLWLPSEFHENLVWDQELFPE